MQVGLSNSSFSAQAGLIPASENAQNNDNNQTLLTDNNSHGYMPGGCVVDCGPFTNDTSDRDGIRAGGCDIGCDPYEGTILVGNLPLRGIDVGGCIPGEFEVKEHPPERQALYDSFKEQADAQGSRMRQEWLDKQSTSSNSDLPNPTLPTGPINDSSQPNSWADWTSNFEFKTIYF